VGVLSPFGDAPIDSRGTSTFVARFIGTPPMNLLPGSLVGRDAGLTVGLRPQDVEAREGVGALQVKVALLEPAGAVTWVIADLGGVGQVINISRNGQLETRVSFGRPVVAGTGIPTAVLAEQFKAGDPVPMLAKEYGADEEAVWDAIRCELALEAA
jgi:uncharacterized protein (DUF433 family)